METSINQEQLKDLIKAALTEVLEERRDLLHEAVEEAFEDVALARAIEESEATELIEREEVFKLFEGEE
jgi:DNA polymerase III alpha subunit